MIHMAIYESAEHMHLYQMRKISPTTWCILKFQSGVPRRAAHDLVRPVLAPPMLYALR